LSRRIRNLTINDEYKEINEIYNEAGIEKRAPCINNYEECDLPSPLGNRSVERAIVIQDQKIRDELKKYYRTIDFYEIVGGQLDMMTKKKVKTETFKLFDGVRRSAKQIADSLNFKNIIAKAKCRPNGSFNKINISHLTKTRNIIGCTAPVESATETSTKKHVIKLMKKYESLVSSSR
jgi:hypothetical protein